MNSVSSAEISYGTTVSPEQIDIVSGFSWGTMIGEGSVNRSLAESMLANADGKPIAADLNLALAFPNGWKDVDYIAHGPATSSVGKGLGTWGTLSQIDAFMRRENMKSTLIVAHDSHVSRILRQAGILEMNCVVPENLPGGFYYDPEQWWVHSQKLWSLREAVGGIVLRAQGRL